MNQSNFTDFFFDYSFQHNIFTGESVKRQITDLISKNLTDTDLESKYILFIGNSLSAIIYYYLETIFQKCEIFVLLLITSTTTMLETEFF